MNRRPFLSVVPKAVQTWAIVAIIITVITGVAVGVFNDEPHELLLRLAVYSAGGLAGGIFLGTWLLCVGYVYADARQRAMRPVLWTLVVIFLPHLLGFLLYFVMRQPLTAYCPQCGLTVAQGQRYCPWCGSPQSIPMAGNSGSDVPPGSLAHDIQG